MKQQLQFAFLLLLVIISFNFFDARFLNDKLVNYTVFFYLFATIAVSAPYIFIKPVGFILPVQLMVMSIVCSIPMAYLAWGQNIKDSIIETVPYLVWILFFYLLHTRVRIATIEKIVLICGAVYIVLYFFQLAKAPTVIFGKSLWGDEFTIDRNMVRIIFPGAGVFVLSIFIAINKLTTQKENRWLWVVFAILGIIIPVLQVTRSFIVGVLLLYLFHFLKDQSLFKRAATAVVSVGVIALYISTTENEIIKGLLEVLERDLKLGTEYIRVLSGTYFLTDFSPHFLNQIFGNGAPAWGMSYYGVFVEKLADRREFFLEDVGIIGMYAMFGLFAVISWIMIWAKSFTVPVPKEHYYLKYYLWYLLFTSLSSWNIYIYHFLISTVFALYIYQVVVEGTKTMELENGRKVKLYFTN